ncbi:MAG TPA: cysteine protease StiP family protein [Cellvibrionaceae bacterium]
MNSSFSGSYNTEDVEFLVTRLPAQPTIAVARKEQLIQSGQRHYSQMLSAETAPSTTYQKLFTDACTSNGARMAKECLTLTALIAARKSGAITLVSLMRGGTPLGVIITRLLRRWLGREVRHYSVSIVRDRGLDTVALTSILKRGAAAESIVFIDGWTGKGVIARELKSSIEAFNLLHGLHIDSGLYALVDLAGVSLGAASGSDYLLPSSILNATVSGLLSRSVLADAIGPGDFHGCVYYSHLAAADVSQWFVDLITDLALDQCAQGLSPHQLATQAVNTEQLAASAQAFLQATQATFAINDINLIKPGIGEATRVLLRRVPRLLIVRDLAAQEVAHLRVLAAEKSVPVLEDAHLPYQAVSLIKSSPDG